MLARSLQSPEVKEAKEHRLGGHGLKMDALERHCRVKVLETATARRVELTAYTSLRMSQNTLKLAALLKAQQALSSSSSRSSTVARRCRCDGGRCTGWQTDGPGRCTNTGHMTVLGVLEFPFVLGRGFDVAEIDVLVWQALTRASYACPSLAALYGAESKNCRDRVRYCITSETSMRIRFHFQSHTQLLLPWSRTSQQHQPSPVRHLLPRTRTLLQQRLWHTRRQ